MFARRLASGQTHKSGRRGPEPASGPSLLGRLATPELTERKYRVERVLPLLLALARLLFGRLAGLRLGLAAACLLFGSHFAGLRWGWRGWRVEPRRGPVSFGAGLVSVRWRAGPAPPARGRLSVAARLIQWRWPGAPSIFVCLLKLTKLARRLPLAARSPPSGNCIAQIIYPAGAGGALVGPFPCRGRGPQILGWCWRALATLELGRVAAVSLAGSLAGSLAPLQWAAK